MSADTLTVTSRAFFERTKGKLVSSLALIAGALGFLALCSIAGGLSAANQEYLDRDINDDNEKDALQSLATGYGFASFFFIIGFLLFCTAGLYTSPLICGSANEKRMISSPAELETGYTSYTENPSAPMAGNNNSTV